MNRTKLIPAFVFVSLAMLGCENDESQQKFSCGNGVLEPGEICDTTQFSSGKDVCPTGTTGSVTCSESCALDTSACTQLPPEEDPCTGKSNHCVGSTFIQCDSSNGEEIQIPCEGETPDCDAAMGCYKKTEATAFCDGFVPRCEGGSYITCDEATGDDVVTKCEGETPDCDAAMGCYKKTEATAFCDGFIPRCEGGSYITCDEATGDDVVTKCEGETPDCDAATGCYKKAEATAFCDGFVPRCEGGSYITCDAATGDDVVTKCEGETPDCDAATGCYKRAAPDEPKCSKGAYYCDGNVFVTCDTATGKETRTTCSGDRPLCHAAPPENGIEHGCEYVQPDDGAHGLPDITTTPYVTPEEFGAKGDGTTDDTQAFQKAIDSGKNVFCTDPSRTYLISNKSRLNILNKKDFQMSGCKIHRPCSDTELYLFWILNTSNASFSNMTISTTNTCADKLTPAGHYRPSSKGSNLLVFSGSTNKNISFINNTFENADADYWFNPNTNSTAWENILIDGWKTDSTTMPLFGRFMKSLTVHDANVKPSPIYSGDGDHCMYVCNNSENILIKNSYFSYEGNITPLVLLTFHHQTNDTSVIQPKDIRIVDTKVEAKYGRALYCGLFVSASVDHCVLSSTNERSDISLISSQNDPKNSKLGTGSWTVKNSVITTQASVAAMTKQIVLEDSMVTAAQVSDSHAFPGQQTVKVSSTDLYLGKGSLFFSMSGSDLAHSYKNANITKTEIGSSYIISKRTKEGIVSFEDSTIDGKGTSFFMYNGGNVDFSGVSFKNTQIKNFGNFGNPNETKNYTAVSSTFNGKNL